MLTGLRGVGKTVLLNALRSAAVRRRWGTGKLEARPDQGLRRPLSSALHQAVRELGHPQADDVDHVLGVIRSFAQREAGAGAKLRDQWSPGIDVPAVKGRADSGDIEIDLVELLTDVGGLAADVGKGVGGLHRRDAGPRPRRRLRALRRLPRDQPVRAAGDRRRAPACRTCRPCSRRASPTPSGSSATSASTGSPARPPTAR